MKAKIPSLMLGVALSINSLSAQNGQATSGESYKFTLDQCLEYAFGNSYERKNMQLTEQSQDETIEQANSSRRPSVNGSVGESAQHTGVDNGDIHFSGNAGVSASVNIYEGGSITNTIKKSKLEKEDATLSTQKYDNSLTIEILNAFLNSLKNEELLKYKSSIVETSREQAEQGKTKYNAGSILESDWLVLEAQYKSNQTDTLDAHINRDNSLLDLKKLMSMAPEASLTIVEPDTNAIDAMALLPSQEEEVNKALESMPEMKLTQSAIDIATIQTEITRSALRPTLSANAGIGTSHRDFDNFGTQLGDNFYQQIGLNLSIPIYDRGQTKSKLTQNKLALQQAENDKAQTELQIRQTVIEQYKNVKLAYEKYKMTRQMCEAYKAVCDVYNAKFKVGAVVITDLLQQQDKYISAINDYIQAKYSFILYRKVLDVYTGDNVSMK